MLRLHGGMAEEMSVPFLGRIPIDPAVVASGDEGRPFVHGWAGTPAAQAFEGITERLRQRVEKEACHAR